MSTPVVSVDPFRTVPRARDQAAGSHPVQPRPLLGLRGASIALDIHIRPTTTTSAGAVTMRARFDVCCLLETPLRIRLADRNPVRGDSHLR